MCVSVKGVSSRFLWFQSVTVSRDRDSECSSSSLSLFFSVMSLLSLLPLLGPSQHLLLAIGVGQGRGS